MHPVGPLNSKVYWIRRVSIVVLAVAVLIGMVWFLASRTSRSSAGAEPVAAAGISAAPTLTGVLAASSEAARMTVSSPSPSPSPSLYSSAAPRSTAPGTTAKAKASAATTPAATKPAATKPAATKPAATKPAATKSAATKSAAPTTTKPPALSYDAQGRLICPDSAIKVAAVSTAPSFVVGSQPRLGMTVTNTGPAACQRDVSGTLQVYTVLSAKGTRMWSTTDCFPGEGTEVRELAPGETVQFTIKWSGTTSAPGCTGQRAPVPAGDYRVIASLGRLSSPPAPFTVTP